MKAKANTVAKIAPAMPRPTVLRFTVVERAKLTSRERTARKRRRGGVRVE